MTPRERWAARMIGAAEKPVPRYGSSEWLALPEGHPAKVAAVVVAAECWAREGDDVAERLAYELEHMRLAHKRHEDAEWAEDRRAHADRWQHLPRQVDAAQRRKATRAAWLRGVSA